MPVSDEQLLYFREISIRQFLWDRICGLSMPPVSQYLLDPLQWDLDSAAAKQFLEYPQFGIDQSGSLFITGCLKVRSQRGHEYGPFTIRVQYSENFPRDRVSPSVYLMSHRDRWKNGFDSHIEMSWRLCLFVPGESGIDFEERDYLTRLLAIAITFLRREVIYQKTLAKELDGGPKAIWPGSDRAHGAAGLIESIKDFGPINVMSPCICGSGKLTVLCCAELILKSADPSELKDLIKFPPVDSLKNAVRSRRPKNPLNHRRNGRSSSRDKESKHERTV